MKDTVSKPKEITSKVLWELYTMLYYLEEPYLVYEKRREAEKELYYIQGLRLIDDGIVYGGPDNMGLELPSTKNEWLEILLVNLKNGRKQSQVCRICVNALYVNYHTVQDLLSFKDLRLATEQELQSATYEPYPVFAEKPKVMLPSYQIPVEVQKTSEGKRGEAACHNAHCLASCMSIQQVAFRSENQNGLTTQEIFYKAEHVPGDILRGTIQYFDLAAEFKLFIPPICLKKYVGAEQKDELLVFLNEVNARIVPRYQADTMVTKDTKRPFSWRIYYAQKTVYLVTMIPYDLWEAQWQRSRTHDTILKDSPKFMDQLTPYIIDILSGRKMTDEAIAELEKILFREDAQQG